MKILVDVNLPPSWVDVLRRHSIEAIHWTSVGSATATDRTVTAWARRNGYVVFTHDLDFGAILAHTGEDGPSVLQVRTQDVTPARLQKLVVAVLRQNAAVLESGAIVVVEETRARVRILPLQR